MKFNTESKTHFKLYKSGKLWLVSGISTAMMFGASVLMNDQQVQADVAQQTSTITMDNAADSTPAANTIHTPVTSASSAQSTTAIPESDGTITSTSAGSAAIATTPVSDTTVDSQVAVPTSSSVTSAE